MGVGAGIVLDSIAADEYAECRLKASFLTGAEPGFELFETMYATREEGVRHLSRHLARLSSSAATLGFKLDDAKRHPRRDRGEVCVAARAHAASHAACVEQKRHDPDHCRGIDAARRIDSRRAARTRSRFPGNRRRRPAATPQNDAPRRIRSRLARSRSEGRIRHVVLQRARRVDRRRPFECVGEAGWALVDTAACVGRAARRDARRSARGRVGPCRRPNVC